MQKSLKDLTITELKALAYDSLVQQQNLQQYIQAINNVIQDKIIEEQNTKSEQTPISPEI
jgi:hypothetical protein